MAARYGWQCTACGDRPAWLAACGSRSVAAFIRDELAPSGWDQALLRRTCRACRHRTVYITYRLKRGDPERVSVRHIVGLVLEDEYLPMVWETFRHASPRTGWVDFKYQRGRSPWGLTKRLVLERKHMSRLLLAYRNATGRSL
ncbi:hypothetical protein GCM10011521_16460 [Arenimonas soli]|uniref:Uncharacterized protein n=1 Tax=Arenimonas soli TaxID=2269504 RepID=A0ABQ1HK15_9GAMM|nr:hypothetical protein [Arenimonas soli]GGA78957.1 hypothetical protein GCM10011521_16460 [Arenimonas soli]